MSRAISLLATLCLIHLPAQAALLVDLTFDDGMGGSTFFNPGDQAGTAGLTISAWSDGDGNGVGDATGVTGRAIDDSGFANGNSFLFTIDVSAGQQMSIDSILFSDRASGTGPSGWELELNSVSLGTGSTHSSFASNSLTSLGQSGLTGTNSFELIGSGASSAGGTWRIDDFQINGSVSAIPEPSALILTFLFGGAAVLLRRRVRPAS